MAKSKKGLVYGIIGLCLIVIVLVIIGYYFFVVKKDSGSATTTGGEDEVASITNKTKATSEDILPETTFTSGLGSWSEHVWYKAASSGGEVTTGSDGVKFQAVQANSRSGIMLDINRDVSSFKKVTITASVVAKLQTLAGTGLNGREAPVAIAVSYVDVDGVDHSLLGEDPKASGQMFWRGFYYLDPTGQLKMTNGVKVVQNQPYTFTFDLMTLNPKPKTINFVGLEGAGWKDREGTVHSVSIVGE